VKGAL
jgi:hypothetical protein